MNSEMISKEERIKQLEAEIDRKDNLIEENRRTYSIKLEAAGHDLDTLRETSKHR